MTCSILSHFLLLILSILCIESRRRVVATAANPQYGRYDRIVKQKKLHCESTTICIKLIPEEAYNCIYSCMSIACYNEVYSMSPLEDGEIDNHRYFQFNKCMHNELKEEYVASVREKKATSASSKMKTTSSTTAVSTEI